MNIQELVDELYEAFAERIGQPFSDQARDLSRALRLAPEPVPWSRVFSHEVTLGAPALFAEAMAGMPSSVVRDAVLAHALAVIDAFGTDRIEDEQVKPTANVLAVLGQARRERDRAMVRIFGRQPPGDCDFIASDVTSMRAIRRERMLLRAAQPLTFDLYESASLEKQCAGIVASMALARVAGWDERQRRAVRDTLEAVWLGLQLYDDVVDWEDDLQNGGSWVVCLMKDMQRAPLSQKRLTEVTRWGLPDDARIRAQVHQSGVLRMILMRALGHMRAARRRASALGAHGLASWAATREARLETVVEAEGRCAGYAVREHALAAWAGEVLA
jgi:hypothetical protein